MSLLASFFVPHPPLILPAIGKGEERKIQATIEAYQEVAETITFLKPDTIVVISPHATTYGDYFYVAPGLHAEGSFASFGAPSIIVDVDYDDELRRLIIEEGTNVNLPCGTLGEKSRDLDHGTMIPLSFIQSRYSSFKTVRLSFSYLPRSDHYRYGMAIKKAIDRTNKSVVVIASGDLSHTLIHEGPYGYTQEGPEFDQWMQSLVTTTRFDECFTKNEHWLEKANECGFRSFLIMTGLFDGYSVDSKLLSYEGPFGVGYLVASFKSRESDESRRFLNAYLDFETKRLDEKKQMEDPYVSLARQSITYFVKNRKRMAIPNDTDTKMLTTKAGVFVSLKKDHQLRGCIGTTAPTTPSVAHEIINNAILAASEDPRFSPVELPELPFIEVSVDVLMEAESIDSTALLNPKIYGVIVQSGHKSGLLLPNLEGVDTVEEQLSIVLRKAHIHPSEPYTMQRFEVIRHD